MEPITAGLLVALASGAAGAAGEQFWASLRDLATRRGSHPGESGLEVSAEPPPTEERAGRLAALLNERARQDRLRSRVGGLATAVNAEVATRSGDVTNEISGGIQGTVIQGRDFHGGITLGGSQGRFT